MVAGRIVLYSTVPAVGLVRVTPARRARGTIYRPINQGRYGSINAI